MKKDLTARRQYWNRKWLRFKSVPLLYFPVQFFAFWGAFLFWMVYCIAHIFASLAVRSYQVFFMSLGYWWCASCRKRQWGLEAKKYITQRGFNWEDSTQYTCCPACHKKLGSTVRREENLKPWLL